MPHDQPKQDNHLHEATLAEARQRLQGVAYGLGQKVGRVDAAGAFVYVALALWLAEWGDVKTAEYLRDLADHVERSGEADAQHRSH